MIELSLMNRAPQSTDTNFTKTERAYVRRELDQVLSTMPRVADGLLLKTWKTGPRTGGVKLSPAAETLVARGLARVEQRMPWPRLIFTSVGLGALKRMLADPKQADPATFAHVRHELGIELAMNHIGVAGQCDGKQE